MSYTASGLNLEYSEPTEVVVPSASTSGNIFGTAFSNIKASSNWTAAPTSGSSVLDKVLGTVGQTATGVLTNLIKGNQPAANTVPIAPASSSMMPLLLLGGAAVVAVVLLKKRKG